MPEMHDTLAGDAVIDRHYFCSTACHEDWHRSHSTCENLGCPDRFSEEDQWCASCGIRCDIRSGGDCDWRCVPNVIRVISPSYYEGVYCDHGVPIQVNPELEQPHA